MRAKFVNEVLSSEDEWANQEIAKNVPSQNILSKIKKPKRVKTIKNVMSIDIEKGTVTKGSKSNLETRTIMAEEIIELEDYLLENGTKEQIDEWIWNAKKIAGKEWEFEDDKTGELKNIADCEHHEEWDYYGLYGKGKVEKMLELLKTLVKEIK